VQPVATNHHNTMMNQTRRKRPQGPRRKMRGPPRELSVAVTHPPQIQDYQVRHSVIQRFVANAAVATAITFQNLLDTILMVLTSTTAADVFYAVKIRKVEMWAAPVQGSPSSLSLQFAGAAAGFVGDQKFHTDTAMGIEPAHVSAKPSGKSLASEYQISSANVAMVIVVPSGTVIDVHLSYVGNFGEAIAAQNAVVAGSPGALSTRGLDGKTVALTALPNVGISSV